MASSGRWKFGNVRPTGSAIVMGLPYLDQAMRVWGRSSGLEVVMMNADTVSETNCVRQPFSVSDIGQNKATVLINRINLFWGTQWRAEVRAKSKTSAKAAQPKTEVTQNA